MTWLNPPWYPLRFELENGDVLEFVGRRNAREIVRSARPLQ